MRDRLIDLIENAKRDWVEYAVGECEVGKYPTKSLNETIADALLADGWIRPPKVIGEKVWYVCDGQVQFTLIEGVEPALRLLGFPKPITRREIGTLIFPTREEAEQALKGGAE